MTSKQKPSNLCVFIQTIMSLLCGRGAITCYGTRKAAAFVSTSAHLGTRPFQKYVPDARSQVPFIKQQSLLYSSTASNSASKHSDEGAFDRILPFEEHSHNSIKITVPQNDLRDTDDQFDIETFYSKLKATVVTAKQLHKTAIWITIPITKARLMEHSHKCGFEFHHAEKNVATLSKWLLDGEESRIPTFATHQVGVGAVAINRETNEILCVREKRNNYRPWKMPGGLAELGEDLDEAVVREVYEETGIKCRFLSILGVRHTHGLQFGRSDLYFLCRLEPVPDSNGKVAQPIPQEGEIEAAAWVPLDEYRAMVNNPDSKIGHPMMKQIMKLADQGEWNEYDIQKTIVSSVVPGRMGSPVYHAAVRSDSRGEIPE
jgi:8-oxo-dGTP pyrophosphatase MutT (NUDIX family)